MDKISVITVVYNDVDNIRTTMESYFAQSWPDKEYIIIDGGSTDGTVDIIKEYSDKLAFWCSEKDNGIYDAMNKGISHVTGDWINILNSGDYYVDNYSLENAITNINTNDVDVIYGNSIEVRVNDDQFREAGNNIKGMEYEPIYRHGSSLIRSKVQKKFLYDTDKENEYGFALDWDMIYRVYKAGYSFKKVNILLEAFQIDGISNKPLKGLLYNYKIVARGKFNLKAFIKFILYSCRTLIVQSNFYCWLSIFIKDYIVNSWLPCIPFWCIRRWYLHIIHAKIGKDSFIMKNNYFMGPNRFSIGAYSHINRGCTMDARGSITIGDNVSISHQVMLLTGGHNANSASFRASFLPINIEDYVWIGAGCTILQGIHIGKGAVICAGAVVTKNVADYAIVAGIPAKKISERTKDLKYNCMGYLPLT